MQRVLLANGFRGKILSSRDARVMTGVSHSTIETMKDGIRPNVENIVKFARGMNEAPAHWLAICGYDWLVQSITPSAMPLDPDAIEISERLKTIDSSLRNRARQATLAVLESFAS